MPELPDVEVFKRYLDSTSLRKTISGVTVNNTKILGGVTPAALRRRMQGRRFTRSRRHGKHLFVRLDGGGWLGMHFGMTGYLRYFKDVDEAPERDRLQIRFSNGYTLGYYSLRLLGRIEPVEDPAAYIRDHELGPDVLDPGFDLKTFKTLVQGTRGIVKSVLMNQSLMAGIGNIYSDEILFQARLHPRVPADKLDAPALRRLYTRMQSVLRKAIACDADPARMPRGWLIPHRARGQPCPRCGAPIAQIKIGGRSAYCCPQCQPGP